MKKIIKKIMKDSIRILLYLLAILVVIYVISRFLSLNNILYIKEFIYDWQQLIGAFLGAFTPITLFFFNVKRQKKQKKKAHLLRLEKSLVMAINNLSDIDHMLHRFLENQIVVAKKRIAQETSNNQYSVGQLFIPFSSTFSFSQELINETINSNYLENLKLDIYITSKDLPLILKDLDRQFERTISVNTQMSLAKLNGAKIQNDMFLANIAEFEEHLRSDFLGQNIPIYLRKLVSARVALKTMNKLGLKKWKETFPFKSPYDEKTEEKMTAYFLEEVNNEIKKLEPKFKSKLFLTGAREGSLE